MSINLSTIHISQLLWLLGIGIIVVAIIWIVRTFFQHLMHWLLRGCGLILLVAAVLYVMHLLKLF